MRSGDLTHRIVIQRATESRDSFGEPIPTWSGLATVWAEVVWGGGTESLQGDREFARSQATIRLRRSTDTVSLREKDRVLVPAGATTLRDGLVTTAATSVVTDTPAVFPPFADFIVRVGTELMIVTAGAGTVGSPYTVTRGAFGTTAQRHQAGTSIVHMAPFDIETVGHTRYAVELVGARSEVRV